MFSVLLLIRNYNERVINEFMFVQILQMIFLYEKTHSKGCIVLNPQIILL